MTKVSPQRRSRIFALHASGRTSRSIASQMQLDPKTVYNILTRPRTRAVRVVKTRPGPKPRVSESQEREIVDIMLEHNKIGLSCLLPMIKEQLHLDVSRSTLQRIAKKHKLCWGKQRAAPALSDANKVKRLAWANKHRRTDFSKIIFSDEKIFRMGGVRYHRYRRGEREVVRTHKWTGQIHVWWAINPNFKIRPVIVSGSLNADGYVKVLKQRTRSLKKNGYIFQQDNAPCHKARKTMTWLASQGVVVHEDWPAQSPDLSPIENAWALINNKVKARVTNTQAEFRAAVLEEINNFSLSQVKSLYDSMSSRIKAVIAAQGDSIRY